MTAPRRRPAFLALLLAALVALAACVPTGARPELTDDTVPELPADVPFDCADPTDPFTSFSVASVRVITADGSVVDRCVLVADTPTLRNQGLQGATDLASYDGMLFAFPTDTEAWFWMQNTILPLSIAFIDANGHLVSTADMEPCPDAVDCPSYGPSGPYRWAIEVPQGRLGDVGLVPDGSFDPTSLPTASE